MYLEHFGLAEAPFNATPDPRFFYRNHEYDEAYATLLYGIRSRQGFIVLTGEVGTGKTTLLRRLMDELGATTRFVFVYHTTLTSDELITVICDELELPVTGGRVKQLQILNSFLLEEATRGGTVVLLLDEAQNLSSQVLEDLRLISNLETNQHKLLQIVLVGQPELQTRLDEPRLLPLRQRVVIRYHLTPLPEREVGAFIQHRLAVAGRHARLFTADAVGRIAACTRGVPRLINIVCHAALLLAYAQHARVVRGSMVEEVKRDLLLDGRSTPAPSGWRPEATGRRRAPASPGWRWAATGAALVVCGLVAVALRVNAGTPPAGLLPGRDLVAAPASADHARSGPAPASPPAAAGPPQDPPLAGEPDGRPAETPGPGLPPGTAPPGAAGPPVPPPRRPGLPPRPAPDATELGGTDTILSSPRTSS